ncbi:hypothetical protein Aperf_G00000111930 [Anoplocephala perfoliata]
MTSGPLVFIHPVIEEGDTGQRPSGSSESESAMLRRVGDDLFYWNTSVARSQSKQQQQYQQQGGTASSAWDLSADWINSPRGHSDPNLQKKTSGRYSAELTFDNCMCNSTAADSSSAVIGPPHSCSPTPASTGTTTMETPGGDWILPWQKRSRTQGLNNEADFFNTRTYQNYAGLGSNATTIVNNRGGFFPPPTPLPQVPTTANQTAMAPRENGGNPFEKGETFPRQQVSGKAQGGNIEMSPSTTSCLPGGNGSPSSSKGGGRMTAANSVQSATVFSKHSGMISPLNRRSSATECANKPVRPSSDTNVISLTDNPGAPMLKMDSTLSLDTDARSRPCCFCWCCCCSCSCVRVRPPIEPSGKRSTHSSEELHRTEAQLLEPRATYEEVFSWSESFDNLMRCFTSPSGTVGQKAFREFLRSEYSEENILFWLACEDLKAETNSEAVEEKARLIYEDYISILSPKEVSLDSRVRDMINANMTQPTPHTFDEAQLQIYTLMQRDSYPRFLNSRIYKDLLALTKGGDS